MKNLKKYVYLILVFTVLSTINSFAQHGGHGGGHGGNGGKHGGNGGGHGGNGGGHNNRIVVVGNNRHGNKVVRSIYRPNKIMVFHPRWGVKRNFNRRWVYFPRYNFYWDNWRNAYVYRNGTVWTSNATPPPVIVNIDINNEKHYELRENDDDVDDVYITNDIHQTEYKPE
jgi:hypothetical protein